MEELRKRKKGRKKGGGERVRGKRKVAKEESRGAPTSERSERVGLGKVRL